MKIHGGCSRCERVRKLLPEGIANSLRDLEQRRIQERERKQAPRANPTPVGIRELPRPTGRDRPVTSRRGNPLA